jgi:hypothetical protein
MSSFGGTPEANRSLFIVPVNMTAANTLSFEEVKNWYHTIDLLLITAVPVPEQETGPLPAFEAIVSGIPVIGTPVGNFRHVPGPKFTDLDEGVRLVNYYKEKPEELKNLAKEQYDYVIKNFSYKVLAPYWEKALTSENGNDLK